MSLERALQFWGHGILGDIVGPNLSAWQARSRFMVVLPNKVCTSFWEVGRLPDKFLLVPACLVSALIGHLRLSQQLSLAWFRNRQRRKAARSSLLHLLPITGREVDVPEVRHESGELDGGLTRGRVILCKTNDATFLFFPAYHVPHDQLLFGLRAHRESDERTMGIYHERMGNLRHDALRVPGPAHRDADARQDPLASPCIYLSLARRRRVVQHGPPEQNTGSNEGATGNVLLYLRVRRREPRWTWV